MLDTNVYIRALETGGPAILLLEQAKLGDIRLDISEPILDEICGILREKFKWDGYRIADIYYKLRAM